MFTTATIQRTRSRTITKVAVGTTFSIFLHTTNYLLGAIHVSLKYLSLLLFFSFTFFGYFVWDFLHMICKFHSANSFGMDFAASFSKSNKNMTLLNGFCSVQLLGVIDTTVGFGGVAESNTHDFVQWLLFCSVAGSYRYNCWVWSSS